MASRYSQSLAVAAILVSGLSTSRVCGHGVFVGRSSTDELRAIIGVPIPFLLRPSPFPGIIGYADAEPGFASAELDMPAEDFFLLDPGCDVQFELVGFDPGIQIVTSHAWVAGETIDFGQPFFDFHLVFNIYDGMIGSTYSLQFRFRDLNGIHGDSPVYTLTFSPAATACTCRGDMNEDQLRNGADVQAFVTCLLQTPPNTIPESSCGCADLDGDGALDDVDIDQFIDHLLAEEHCPA